MHPGNDTCAILIRICFVKSSADHFICDHGRLPDDLVWQVAGSVQSLNDDL